MSGWGRFRWIGLAVSCVLGCGPVAEGEGTDREGADPGGDIGGVSQALGAFTLLHSEEEEHPLSVGPTHAVLVKHSGSCAVHAVSVDVGSGSSSTMPFFGCRWITGGAADGGTFVQDSISNDILQYTLIAEGVLGWKKVADTTGPPSGKLFLNATHVFWSDGEGIRRVPRAGGSVTTLQASTNAALQAMNGSFLYYTVPVSGGVKLRRVDVNGINGTSYGAVIPEMKGLGLDSTYAYWADNSAATRRIARLSLSTGAVSDVTSATDRYYYVPRSTGTSLYYVFLRGAECRMIRRTLSTGNSTPADFPHFLVPADMRVGSDYVYTAGATYAADVYSGAVYRGDR